MGSALAETTVHGFTPEQLAWLDRRVNSAHPDSIAFDKSTIKWLIGGLTTLGLAVSGILYMEISSLQETIGSMQNDIRTIQSDIKTNQANIQSIQADIQIVQAVIQTNQTDIRANQGEIRLLREDNKSLREQVQANMAALVRIETVLDERLPKN